MPTRLLLRLLVTLFTLGISALGATVLPTWQGHWNGTISFRGDTWPIRLALPAATEGATIDLPELWMAEEPVPLVVRGNAVTVSLPFGLGDVALAPCDEGHLCGAQALGDDTLAIRLERDEPPAIDRIPVVLRSGVATLHGEFRSPPGNALPAVVLVHGSANNTRDDWNYRSAADFWLRRGHAVLLYDKRGSGESTGDWMTTSFPDLADLGADLRAALDWVARQPGVDPARIGVHGGSQALWTVAIASRLGPRPAFAVLSGAPATTPLEQERDSVLRRLDAGDLTPAQREAAGRHVAAYFAAASDPSKTAAAIASSLAAREAPWGELVPKARSDDDFFWWRRNHGVDPGQALRDWDTPVLLLYGEADTTVAPELHLPRMRALIRPDVLTVGTYPGAAHNLELPGGRDATGQWRFPRRHPGAAATIDAWLAARRGPVAR
jgi:pimeloyl-ACP methyl ester carboxylesterase